MECARKSKNDTCAHSGEGVMSDQRRPRGFARFREREVTRITKAVRVAGGGKVTLDPESGRYTIVVASEGEGMPPDNNTDNPWDEVLTDAADEKRSA